MAAAVTVVVVVVAVVVTGLLHGALMILLLLGRMIRVGRKDHGGCGSFPNGGGNVPWLFLVPWLVAIAGAAAAA